MYMPEQENLKVMTNLIDIATEMHNITFNELMDIEKEDLKDTNYYQKTVEKLDYFRLKERRLLENTKEDTSYYDFLGYIDYYVSQKTYDQTQAQEVKQRVVHILNTFETQNDIYLEEEEKQDMEIRDYTIAKINYDYLRYMNENKKSKALKEKYRLSFINPKIQSRLLLVDFDLDKLPEFKEVDEARMLGLTLEQYQEEIENAYYDYTSDYIKEICQFGDPEAPVSLNEVEFLSKNLSTPYLQAIKGEIKEIIQEAKDFDLPRNPKVKKINKIINKELKSRNDLINGNFQEENTQATKLDEKTVTSIFELIKIESKIYDNMFSLVPLEKDKKQEFEKVIKELETLTKKEKALLSQINMDTTIKEAIFENVNLISGSFEIINDLKEENLKTDLIKNRLLNLFPSLDDTNTYIYKNPSEPEMIIRDHKIQTIKQFEKQIDLETYKEPLQKAKYEELFVNSDLTDSFIDNNGQIEEFVCLDDKTNSEILDIDLNEYILDKQMLMRNMALSIIDNLLPAQDIIEALTPLEEARFTLGSISLDVALKNMDEDDVYFLQESYPVFTLSEINTKEKKQNKKVKQKTYQEKDNFKR